MLDLKTIIDAAIKAHPAFRFASAVAGIAAFIVIFSKFGLSPIAIVLGTIAGFGLMVVFVVFASLSRLPDEEFTLPARVMLWSALILMVSSLSLLFTSVFFGKPLSLQKWMPGDLITQHKTDIKLQNIDRIRVALVIGNSSYPELPLRAPKHDATLIADRLSKAGFRVNLLLDATREEIINAWSHIETVATYGGVALLYYSGYGISVDGTDFIVPVDANHTSRDDIIKSSLSLPQLKRKLPASLSSGSNGELILHSAAPGEAAMDVSPGSIYSPFALAFASAVGKENADIYHIFRLAASKTKEQSGGSQTPWISGNFDGAFHPSSTQYDSSIGVLRLMIFDVARINPFTR